MILQIIYFILILRYNIINIIMELENITVYLNDKILLQKYSYLNNKLHGLYNSYWKNGKIKKSCEYIDGKLHGVFKEFYENSNLQKSCTYNNDKLNGVYKEFYENSQIKKSCSYIDGKLHGVYKEFYENSNLKIFCNYIDGNIIGDYKEFYENSNPRIYCVYIKEGIHGEYYKYYDIKTNSTSVVEELSFYMWGEKYGESIEYYKSGKVKIICNYSKDELDGEYIEYNENRDIIKERRYFRGEIEFAVESAVESAVKSEK